MQEEKALDIKLENTWTVICKDAEGREKWREVNDNLVTNAGLDDILDKYLKGSSYRVLNTDAQALLQSSAENRVQLGQTLTRGLGAGANQRA